MKESNKTAKAHCNKCLGERNHFILHEQTDDWSEVVDDRHEVYGGDTFQMLKCCGCDNVNLQQSSWCSEDTELDGRPAVTVTYFPPAISRAEPSWLNHLLWDSDPDKNYIGRLLKEIYSALHNDSRRLAVMGVRALLEHLMISTLQNDYGAFVSNLENFQVQGNVSPKQREIIESVLEAGHATMHRRYNPNSDDVNTVVDIAENLIVTLLVHPEKSEELKGRVPKKKK